jgi:predicted transcriptional regulator
MAPTRPPFLGDLELAVMDHVWSRGPSDVKACHRAIGARRGITHNTVQSTMERLFRKGLLERQKVSHAYVYQAALAREEYGARVAELVVSSVVGRAAPAAVLAAFVDLAERAGEESLARLERLIAERRADRERR